MATSGLVVGWKFCTQQKCPKKVQVGGVCHGETGREKVTELQEREVTPLKSLLKEAALRMGQAGWMESLLSTFHVGVALATRGLDLQTQSLSGAVEWPYDLAWLIPFSLGQ